MAAALHPAGVAEAVPNMAQVMGEVALPRRGAGPGGGEPVVVVPRSERVIVGCQAEQAIFTEQEVVEALSSLDPVWEELFPDEQARILHLLMERVDIHPEGAEVRIRADGLRSLVAELRDGAPVRSKEVTR